MSDWEFDRNRLDRDERIPIRKGPAPWWSHVPVLRTIMYWINLRRARRWKFRIKFDGPVVFNPRFFPDEAKASEAPPRNQDPGV